MSPKPPPCTTVVNVAAAICNSHGSWPFLWSARQQRRLEQVFEGGLVLQKGEFHFVCMGKQARKDGVRASCGRVSSAGEPALKHLFRRIQHEL